MQTKNQRRETRESWNTAEVRRATHERVGMRLREERTRRAITLDELAEKVGLKAYTLGKIEEGRFIASLNTLEAIANAIGCKIDITELP